MAKYTIKMDGYCDTQFEAATKAKAFYAAYKQFCDAVTKIQFADWVHRARVAHTPPSNMKETSP